MYMTCVYIGCSTQSVPSWSNVTTRASGGTKFAPPGVVVSRTKLTIAVFVGPSFHEGSGSLCAAALAAATSKPTVGSARCRNRDRGSDLIGVRLRSLVFAHRCAITCIEKGSAFALPLLVSIEYSAGYSPGPPLCFFTSAMMPVRLYAAGACSGGNFSYDIRCCAHSCCPIGNMFQSY